MSKSVIIIPSRLAATRLPNKPLIKIKNKSLIMHVYEKAIKSNSGDVYVATCDKEIADEVDKNGGKFIMTSATHLSGTDRVYEACKKLNLQNIDYVINLQGDEPMINPEDIKNLNLISKFNNFNFSTLAFDIKNKDDYLKKSVVKVKTNNKISISMASTASYFYRKIFSNYDNVYHHYGVYLYKLPILEKFVKLKRSDNEINENLEQLRALDNKINIHVLLAKQLSFGIDTKQDLHNYAKYIN